MAQSLPARMKELEKLHGDSISGGISRGFGEQATSSSSSSVGGGGPGGPNNENWRAFGNDSEAGRLLAKLYGGSYKPAINYPPLKTRKADDLQDRVWRPTDKANNVDPRLSKFDKGAANRVCVPKNFGRGDRHAFAPVDLVPKKRSGAECKATIADFEMRDRAYRPPNRAAFSSDAEKERLAEVFTYKGGAALPAELTNMVGPMPSEMKRQQAELERVEKAKSSRRARLNGGVDPMAATSSGKNATYEETDPKELLFDQIYDEIKDRRAFQAEMEETKDGKASRRQVAGEISQRISKLKQLNPGRAAEVIAELYA